MKKLSLGILSATLLACFSGSLAAKCPSLKGLWVSYNGLLNNNQEIDPIVSKGTVFLRTSCTFELDLDGNLLTSSVCNAYNGDGALIAAEVSLQGGYTVIEDTDSGVCKVEGTTTTLNGSVIMEVVDATINRSSTLFSGIEFVDATGVPIGGELEFLDGLGEGTRPFMFFRAD
jgi:hypothetical protein